MFRDVQDQVWTRAAKKRIRYNSLAGILVGSWRLWGGCRRLWCGCRRLWWYAMRDAKDDLSQEAEADLPEGTAAIVPVDDVDHVIIGVGVDLPDAGQDY